MMTNVWPCIASLHGLHLRLSTLKDSSMIAVSSCGVLSGLEGQAKTLGTLALLWLLNIIILHFTIYFLSTWAVIFFLS